MPTPRNELKFFLHTWDAFLLQKRLDAVMQRDLHTDPASSYKIRSLYFDDQVSSAYFEKVNGVNEREKYRIRFYNDSLSYIRLERKAKISNLCFKEGCLLSLENTEKLLSETPTICEQDSSLLADFKQKIKFDHFRPVVLVDYIRRAYFHPSGNVRITLDSNLCAVQYRGDLLDAAGAVPCIPENRIILEVKFDSIIPSHIKSLLYDVPKDNCAISKYCLCCERIC